MPSCYDIVWAVPVVGGGVAAFGNPRGGEPVDIAFECGVVVVNEAIATAVVRVVQRTDQERCDLTSRDGIVWTEPVVYWWVAAPGDPGGSEPFDICFEDRAVVVTEWIVQPVGEIQASDEEGGDLTPGHGVVGAEPIVQRWVAASGDALVCHPLDVCFKDTQLIADVAGRTTGPVP